MRDFYFFTSKKMTAADCFESLQQNIKHVKMNGDTDIWIDASSRSFLWFYNELLSDGFYESEEEFVKEITLMKKQQKVD